MGKLLLDLEDIRAVFDEIAEEPAGTLFTVDEVAVTNASSRCLLENSYPPNGIEQVCQHFASWRREMS